MQSIMKYLLTILGSIVLLSYTHGQAERKFIRQGNREYDNKTYDKSEVLYRKALEKNDASVTSEFNLADALYKQEKYDEAGRKFENLAPGETDKTRLGAIYHNLGNSLLQSQQLEQSIEAYKNSLRNNPKDLETKYNLAYAMSLLQQQQQQQNKDQNKDQQQNKQDQRQKNQQNQQQDQQQQQQQEKDQQEQQSQPEHISKEDAQRILEALRLDEQQVQEKLQKEKAATKMIKVLKEW